MPELPEVETIKRGLEAHILNQTIVDTVVRQSSLRWPVTKNLKKILSQATITDVARRSKYLLLHTSSDGTLVIHLGMSGTVRVVDASTAIKKHDHVDIVLNNKKILRYNDPRRFGAILWLQHPLDEHALFKHLGPEPLTKDFNHQYLIAKAQKRKVPIKNFIMDNKVVVGVGNIYATEALYYAKINPAQAAHELSSQKLEVLVGEIKKVLTKAIKRGGTTLKDFAHADGKPGYFKQELAVYGQAGKPCKACRALLEVIKQQGRTTTYCPNCQK